MRTANLELQKARSVLAPVCVPTMALSTASQEKTSSFGTQVFSGERLVSTRGPNGKKNFTRGELACADDTGVPLLKKNLLAGIISQYHHNEICRSWNIAPTQDVLAIRFNPETKQCSLDAMQSGLIPLLGKRPQDCVQTINARVETVDTAPSSRQTFKKRRCLMPVTFTNGRRWGAGRFRI